VPGIGASAFKLVKTLRAWRREILASAESGGANNAFAEALIHQVIPEGSGPVIPSSPFCGLQPSTDRPRKTGRHKMADDDLIDALNLDAVRPYVDPVLLSRVIELLRLESVS
jgi:hypothetical protein